MEGQHLRTLALRGRTSGGTVQVLLCPGCEPLDKSLHVRILSFPIMKNGTDEVAARLPVRLKVGHKGMTPG